jgi:hypothetical protein
VSGAAMQEAQTSKAALWAGYVISGLVVAFLLLDAGMKLMELDIVNQTMTELGYPAELSFGLGVLTLICTLLYSAPQTATLGAILLTGLLGGAIATHLRVGSPVFSHLLFGGYLGLMVWGGLFLRDARLRALIPFRR